MPRIDTHNDLIYPELCYEIYGFCFKVHNEKGRYLNERQYADALEQEFKNNKLKYERQGFLPKAFPGELSRRNKPDFFIEGLIPLDVKAKRIITKSDYYQIRRYLESADKKLGLIVNFRDKYLKPKRIINSAKKDY